MASRSGFSWAHLGLVVLGGALGTAARAGLLLIAVPVWQTLVVPVINLLGGLLLGVLTGLLVRHGDTSRARAARQFFGTGVLGGFTTYSTFALQAAEGASLWLTLGTAVLGVVAALVGLRLARGPHGEPRGSARGAATP
ncbi:CrcB family protein [Microbacterium sp. cx-55]|uniref:fluoride efflux transporter FluC n=1 Tax=Microbacterium sp. cx-55 TaxID=2875948 RepID=UPI001CBBE22E|nr:CrcB family protein [Microbacterium sp. cx-55]UGB35395.1 CrcB family protein [Microbacterium sp. cx-55]